MKYKKIIGIIAIVFSLLFTMKVSALKINAGEFPDIPEGYVNAIITNDNGTYKLYAMDPEVLEEHDIVNYKLNATNISGTEVYIIELYNIDTSSRDPWGSFQIFNLNNDEWQATSDYADSINTGNAGEVIYSESNVFDSGSGNVVFNAGYGTSIASLFETVTIVIGGIMTTLSSITSALTGNTIFQLVFAIGTIFIVIGVVYSLFKKYRKRGR